MVCKCRNCGKIYEAHKSRADYTGYCSQRCMKDKAKKYGWRSKLGESGLYKYLKSNNAIGDVFYKHSIT